MEQAVGPKGPPTAQGQTRAFEFSTDKYREHERIAAWREVFGRTLLKIDVSPLSRDGFRAHARILQSPGIGVLRAQTAAVDQTNPRGLISNDDISFGCVLTGGWSAWQLDRRADLGPGDGVLMSNSDVGGLSLPQDCRFVTFGMPRSTLAALVPDIGALFARRVSAADPAVHMLMRYLDLADDETLATETDLCGTFAGHVADLLALALGATRDAAERARIRGVPAARLRAIKDDVRKSCRRPDLSIHALAARHGVTARYVQRLFEEGGTTFTLYVAEQRLALAYKVLRRHASEKTPISAIALDCGFSDVSHFNRLFRRHFGCTPSDVREMRPRGA